MEASCSRHLAPLSHPIDLGQVFHPTVDLEASLDVGCPLRSFIIAGEKRSSAFRIGIEHPDFEPDKVGQRVREGCALPVNQPNARTIVDQRVRWPEIPVRERRIKTR